MNFQPTVMSFHSSPKNIIIAGFVIGGPLGGFVWHHLQYVVGLHLMGHNVLFVEDSGDHATCYNPLTHEVTTNPTYGLTFINNVMLQFGLQNQWAYYNKHQDQWLGNDEKKVKEFINKADVFLNLSGVNPLRDDFLVIPVRVFIDTDPVFSQIRNIQETAAFDCAMKHTHFFTYGENFGKPDCGIPDDGFAWQPTRQPVLTDAWHYTPGNKAAKWTTIMQWDSYKVREYNGQVYGMKSASFGTYSSLPSIINETFELAIGSASAPLEKLTKEGWQIADPISVSITPIHYQQYIQQSKGEWSIAKNGYAATNCGWFSERSTCYLASGRPVVVQSTGFSEIFETGRGLFSFTSLSDAVAAIEQINYDYEGHCRWAREIAEEYFRFDRVLSALLENCLTTVPTKE